MPKKDKNKKNEKKQYSEYEKSHPIQLELFSFPNIFEDKRDKYSGTVELYDVVPKYIHDDVDKLRKDGKYLDILSRNFVHRKQNMKLNIIPARLLQDDGTTKDFFPTKREEIIEDVLRKFATDPKRNEFLDDRLSVRFTLYDLWKELKKIKHEYTYWQIKESLDILCKTNIEIKSEDNKITFSSNMFETCGIINENEDYDLFNNNDYDNNNDINSEEYNKKVIYFVRFNSLVSNSIKDKSWRIINYEQCMAYHKVISRWLHKRISHMFLINNITIPYNILLSTIIRDSGMTIYDKISNNIRQVEDCLKEMIKIGSIEKYEMEKIFSKERANKLEDVKFLLWVSKSFYDDMQLGYLSLRDGNKETKKIENNNQNKTKIKNKTNKNTDNNIIIDNDPLKHQLKKLLKEYELPEKEIDNIINYKTKQNKTDDNIKTNILSAIDYIEKQREQGKKCRVGAIITSSLKEDWKSIITNEYNEETKKEEQKQNNIKEANEKIEATENKEFKEMLKALLKEFNIDIFNIWISKLDLVSITEKEITLSTPTLFIKDWIIRDYLNGIKRKIDGKEVWIRKGIKQVIQEVKPTIENVNIVCNK